MSAPRLRDALASLHHDRRAASSPLTREAEQAIGRRVARRWGVRAAAVTAAGAVAFAGGAAWLSAADTVADAAAAAAPSLPAFDLTAFDPPAPSVVQVPVSGGPEFARPEDAYVCGDPAPGIRPTAWDIALDIGTPVDSSLGMPGAAGVPINLTYLGESDAGVATVGEIALVLVRDGRIAGALENVDSQLVWPLVPGASFETGARVFAEDFTCKRRSAEGQHKYFETAVDPGEYDVVAVANVFSTEESVALGQAVPPWYRLDESSKDPGGIYAPGSYDCARLKAAVTVVRGCLPDLAPEAVLDIGGGSVSVTYDPSAWVAPFKMTLVSTPFPVTLAAQANAQTDAQTDTQEGSLAPSQVASQPLVFTSVDEVVCGAIVNDILPAGDTYDSVEVQSRLPSLSSLQPATYRGSVMPWLAPQGSSVRLEAGARLVYLLEQEPSDAESGVPVFEVVGFAPVTLADVVSYDRYRGPTPVELDIGTPTLCADVDAQSVRLSETPLLVATWAVTTPTGTQTRHGEISITWPQMP